VSAETEKRLEVEVALWELHRLGAIRIEGGQIHVARSEREQLENLRKLRGGS